MGIACCNKEEEKNTLFQKTDTLKTGTSEIKKNDEFEESEIDNFEEDIESPSILSVICKLEKKFQNKVTKISFVEFYNIYLSLREQENAKRILLFDMREQSEIDHNQKFLKNISHINYTYSQIRTFVGDSLENFKLFIENKIIIFIISQHYISKLIEFEKTKKENNINDMFYNFAKIISPMKIISLLNKIQPKIHFYILNTTFHVKELNPISVKILDFLNNPKYDILPYVLLNYNHITNCSVDGFFYLHFNQNLSSFNFANLSNALHNKKDPPNYENLFLRYMDITTNVIFENRNEKIFGCIDYKFKSNVFKEYVLSIEDISNKDNIKSLCIWLKEMIIKGHSVLFNMLEFEEDNLMWLTFIVLLINIITDLSPYEIINYFQNQITFIPDFNNKINNYIAKNSDKLEKLFIEYGVKQFKK